MKIVLVTQRVYVNIDYGERYDQLDQRWITFLQSLDIWPVLAPNNPSLIKKFIEKHSIDGVLLTGGNSLVRYGGDAPERDETEKTLLDWALNKDVPLLGVCRGMQVIQNYYDNELCNVTGHVGERHILSVESGCRLSDSLLHYPSVNSYHNQGATDVSGDIVKAAESEDGVVMAIEHIDRQVFGVMWHPEREETIQAGDQVLFKYVFGM